ncbi:hypothetical protein C3Y87_04710 [Carbonactinospora thermoautotrophica]|uniref:DUF2510 domain-containing protein n=1 Tax=Carbonactinospora thermoautotrophica TaxID=1469144 RepID=UPI00226EAB33|nr:DUF2510 domain-containing protein [Carbonactinospora thermoautotrophica]MCX9190721.1 hypothetical protein [Carbonactinospora thermoautotrophica]
MSKDSERTTGSDQLPPGWYPDPAGQPGMERYWDGQRWLLTTRPAGPPPMPPPGAPGWPPPGGFQPVKPRSRLPWRHRLTLWSLAGAATVAVLVLMMVAALVDQAAEPRHPDLSRWPPAAGGQPGGQPGSGGQLTDESIGITYQMPPGWYPSSAGSTTGMSTGSYRCPDGKRSCVRGYVSSGVVTGDEPRTAAEIHGKAFSQGARETTVLQQGELTVDGHRAYYIRWRAAPSNPAFATGITQIVVLDLGARTRQDKELGYLFFNFDTGHPEDPDPALIDQIVASVRFTGPSASPAPTP